MEIESDKECECEGLKDSERCRERKEGFACMREEDHEGDHVACGEDDHRLKVWGEGDE